MKDEAAAQSLPNCSEMAGQARAHTAPTELDGAQESGPRRQDKCRTGANEPPSSGDCPTKKPASNSSAQAKSPLSLQLRQRIFAHDSRSNASVLVGARQTPSIRPLASANRPSGESANPSKGPVKPSAESKCSPPSRVTSKRPG